MIRDFEQDKRLGQYDLCVVGAGPAGISLALRMVAGGWRVALIEGGGRDFSERSQAIYQEAESSGMNIWPGSTRLRYFGGTSNHWTGRCRPFERDDFERAPQSGVPGWPISFDEMHRYMPEAMGILDLQADGFVAKNEDMAGGSFLADKSALSSPTRFGSKYEFELRESRLIDVLLNCNCVDLLFRASTSQLAGIKVSDYKGQTAIVQAGRYVLAMGALENARFLLSSESMQTAGVDGLRWAGRSFMEHLNVDLGTFIYADDIPKEDREYFTAGGFVKKANVGRGNISIGIVNEITSYGRTAAIKSFLKNLACDLNVEEKVQFIANFSCPGSGRIGTLLEQFPSVDGSSVTLLNERDALGVRKIKIHWELSLEDEKTIRFLGKEFAKQFAQAKLGFVRLNEAILNERAPITAAPHAHHMGTTRMANSASWGVVDKNSKVFGVNNLYISGSSVFSTGGGCNPTMPIIQLSLRLGDHLLALGR